MANVWQFKKHKNQYNLQNFAGKQNRTEDMRSIPPYRLSLCVYMYTFIDYYGPIYAIKLEYLCVFYFFGRFSYFPYFIACVNKEKTLNSIKKYTNIECVYFCVLDLCSFSSILFWHVCSRAVFPLNIVQQAIIIFLYYTLRWSYFMRHLLFDLDVVLFSKFI